MIKIFTVSLQKKFANPYIRFRNLIQSAQNGGVKHNASQYVMNVYTLQPMWSSYMESLF